MATASTSAGGENTVQALLRFLTQTARLPLPQALSLAKPLNVAGLSSISSIAEVAPSKLSAAIACDDKLAKQIHGAAKRAHGTAGKKRKAGIDGEKPSSPSKKTRITGLEDEEANLLPQPSVDEDEISATVLVTNRAPLLLAFVVVLLQFTKPEQPLSSRLSMAQAVVSANAQSKATSIGLRPERVGQGPEGPGKGFRGLNVMGRDISVLRRDTECYFEANSNDIHDSTEPALWGLDLEALAKSDGRSSFPIHTPQAARSYLLRAFSSSRPADADTHQANNRSKKDQQDVNAHNLSLLLGSLELLFTSWQPKFSSNELNAKAWNWYVQVRPEVAHGIQGWGAKGEVGLKDVLQLRAA